MKLQKTIKDPVKLAGKGLFGGQDATVTFHPAPEETGIVFVRTDMANAVRIPAMAPNIAERSRRTSIKKGEVSIETVEHCLAAIHALEIDNIVMEVEGPELPAPIAAARSMSTSSSRPDSSSRPTPARNSSSASPCASPPATRRSTPCPHSDGDLSITYDLDYSSHAGIGRQIYSYELTPDSFEAGMAPARSFLLEVEAKQFQARGIGTHIGPNDILVIDSDGPIKNSYRWPNECVRHKIVDLIGDLMLVGRPVIGRIVAYKSGHALNQQLVRKLYDAAQQQDRIETLRDRRGARHPPDSEDPAAPLPHAPRGQDHRGRRRHADQGHQERDFQRAVLPGPFPLDADHAGRADRRGDGPGLGIAVRPTARAHRQAGDAPEHGQRETAQAGGARATSLFSSPRPCGCAGGPLIASARPWSAISSRRRRKSSLCWWTMRRSEEEWSVGIRESWDAGIAGMTHAPSLHLPIFSSFQ